MNNAKCTSFATRQDMARYIQCRDNGGGQDACLAYGDNGTGAWGDECWNPNGMPGCALPSGIMKIKYGQSALARRKPVTVQLIGKGHGNPFTVYVLDQPLETG